MADEKVEAETPPAWFNDFKDQLGGALGTINQQQQALAQSVQDGAARAPAATPSQSLGATKESDEKLLNEFVQNPTRFISQLDEVITHKATTRAQNAIAASENNRRAEVAAERFETDFFGANPDMEPYRALLIEKMQTTQSHLQPGQKADAAAVEVRAMLKDNQANAVENERRQRAASLAASGARGFSAAVGQGSITSGLSEGDAREAAFRAEKAYRQERK